MVKDIWHEDNEVKGKKRKKNFQLKQKGDVWHGLSRLLKTKNGAHNSVCQIPSPLLWLCSVKWMSPA